MTSPVQGKTHGCAGTLVSFEIILQTFAPKCVAQMCERLHHMILDRRTGNAELKVNRTIRFHLDTVHREDPSGSLRQSGKSALDQDFGFDRVQSVLLVGTTRRIVVFRDGHRGDPASLPSREVDRQVTGYTPQKAAGIAQVVELDTGRGSYEDFLRQITGMLRTDLLSQIGKHAGALVSIERLETR